MWVLEQDTFWFKREIGSDMTEIHKGLKASTPNRRSDNVIILTFILDIE